MRTTTLLLAAIALVAVAAAPALVRADDARAAQLYQLCEQCHGDRGQGDRLALAPAIAGLSDWYVELQLDKFRHGYRGKNPDDVAGLRMYPMSLAIRSDEDVKLLASYVSSLPAADSPPQVEGGDAARGKQLYVTCQACHGPDGKGIQAVGGPNLVVSSDWYLLGALEKYKAGIRGTNAGDVAGMRMRPMSLILPDEQAMKDVVAYIMTLGR
jgi:cytochrome c oxidase subunit 2